MSAQAQPLGVVTEWGAHGAVLLLALYACIAAAGLLYWYLLRGRATPSLPLVTALCAAGLILAWFAPVLFSSDVYAYAAYGELARLGLDPYVRVAPNASDALVADAIWQWSGSLPICVYGPAFVAIAKTIVAALAPLGTLAQLQGMRVLASGALLACVPAAYAAFGGDRAARLRAAATLGVNPVAVWCAAEGHNDALALFVVLAGFALARRLPAAGAALVALSATIKLPGVAAAVGLAAADRRTRLGAGAGLAIAALVSLPLLAGVATQVAPHGHYAPQASLQALLAPLGEIPALLLAGAAAATLAARALIALRAGRAEGWVLLGLAAWLLVPNPYPWYGIWLVALAAMAPRTRAAGVALALSFTSLLRYAPDAVTVPGPPLAAVLGGLAALPLLGLLL